MSTPVRIGRVSSREAARPTLFSVIANGSRPMVKASAISNGTGLREVAGRPGVQRERGRAGADAHAGLGGVDVDGVVGQVAHHVGEQPRRHHHVAVALDVGDQAGLDGEFHVCGVQVEPAVRGLEQHAGQHRQSTACGHATCQDSELVDQRRTVTRESHSWLLMTIERRNTLLVIVITPVDDVENPTSSCTCACAGLCTAVWTLCAELHSTAVSTPSAAKA